MKVITVSAETIVNNLSEFARKTKPSPRTPEGVAVTSILLVRRLMHMRPKIYKKMLEAIDKADIDDAGKFIFMTHLTAIATFDHPLDNGPDEPDEVQKEEERNDA